MTLSAMQSYSVLFRLVFRDGLDKAGMHGFQLLIVGDVRVPKH